MATVTVEMSVEERDALLPTLATLENKARKGEFWRARIAPVAGLFERIRTAVPR